MLPPRSLCLLCAIAWWMPVSAPYRCSQQKTPSNPLACSSLPIGAHILVALEKDGRTQQHLQDGEEFLADIGKAAVSDACDLSERNPLVKIPLDTSLAEAVRLIAQKHLRRLAVVDEHDTVVAILAPSAILKFLTAEVRRLKDQTPFSRTVDDLSLGSKPVKSVTRTQSMLDAMDLMYHNHISVVAVLDETSHTLVGSLSMSDIRLVFRQQRYRMLLDTCLHFIQTQREESVFESYPYYAVQKNASLAKVIEKIIATHVHHLYVVDDQHHATSVISLTDILEVLVRELAL